MTTIDLNCDMGESFGAWTMGQDDAVLAHVTSANIACGFHAGDPSTMRRTVAAAVRRGVAIGAHPSLPDLAGFGRREMRVSADETYAMTLYQIGALAAVARAAGTALHHVKPHGALYNMAAKDRALAGAIAAGGEIGALRMRADTICVHGDRADAATFARRLRESLEGAGVRIATLDRNRAA